MPGNAPPKLDRGLRTFQRSPRRTSKGGDRRGDVGIVCEQKIVLTLVVPNPSKVLCLLLPLVSEVGWQMVQEHTETLMSVMVMSGTEQRC